MNGQTRARQPEGTPAGGQFAATARTEPDVSLSPPAQLTSSDGIEGYQHPRHVARFDAITAFNDDDGTYTIGDDLNAQATGMLSSRWIDSAGPLLAAQRADSVDRG